MLAVFLLCLTSVPKGQHGLRRLRGSQPWSAVSPGLTWRIPLLQEFQLTPDEVTVRGVTALPVRSGGGSLEYAVTARFTDAAIRMAAARAMTPGEFLAANVGEILEVAPALPPPGIEALLRSELERRGLTGLVISAREGAGTQPEPRRELERPILVVGLDGADWQVAEPLIEAGRLPVLARLRREGAWGHLRSSVPMLSPLLWTTAATGKTPDRHGIVDFLVPDPATGKKVPITSEFRQVKALWNIFGDRGLFSSIVGWWATYPAENIRGEIISDRVAYSLFEIDRPEAAGSGLVHPEGLWAETAPRIVDAAAITAADLAGLAAVSEAEVEAARRILKAGGSGATRDRLVHLMKILASTRTYHAVALDRIAAGQPDLLAVYYQGIDEVSHRFAHCMPPAMALCPPGDAERYGGTVAAFYEYQDRLLGEVLEAIDPDSWIVVLSDHGFRNGGDRPTDVAPDIDGKPAKWHRTYGVAVIVGPGLEPRRLDTVTLLDITPTVLRLAGLPTAEDMPGRALVEPDRSAPPPPAIASYETQGGALQRAALTESGASGQEEMLENLRSLGYIGDEQAAAAGPPPGRDAGATRPAVLRPGGEGGGRAGTIGNRDRGESGGGTGGAAGTPSTVTAHTNVAALHLQKGELDRAEAEFRAALAIAPAYLPALMGMAEVRSRQDRPGDAYAFTARAITTAREPEPGAFIRHAVLSTQCGKADEAESTLERMRGRLPRVAEIPVGLAILAEHRGDRSGAESLLESALAVEPAGSEAMSRLFRLRREKGREADLEPAIRKALEINSGSVLHHNWLGLILERRGDGAGAEREFKRAMEIAPDFGGTMANLGSLYGRTGRYEEAVGVLERALRIEPFNLEARVYLGAALGKLGRTAEALRVLEKGRESAPSSPEILNALAVTHAQMGDTAKAAALFRESLGIRADQPKVRAMLKELEGGL